MNRVLLVVNVVLALVLSFRVFADPAAAAALKDLAPDRLSVDVSSRGDGSVPSLVVQLGAALRPVDATEGPVDLGVQLDPPQPVLTSWRSERQLLVVPARPLPGSRTQRVVFSRELRGNGARIAAGTIVPFTTPAVKMTQVVLLDDEGAPAPALRVVFDQAVTADAVKQCVHVRAAGDASIEIPVVVELPPEQAQATAVVLRPQVGQELPEVVSLVVRAGLVAAGGDVATTREVVERVRWRDPLRLTDLTCVDGALQLAFTHEVPLPLAEQIRLQPPVPFQAQCSDSGLRLVGTFAPGTVVTVELAAGFPGHGRQRLAAATRRSLLLPDHRARLSIAQGGHVLCSSARPVLTIEGVNVERVQARLLPVYPNNLVRALQRGDSASFAPVAAHDLPVPVARNETWTFDVDLTALAGGPPRGLYRFELSQGPSSWPQRRWLQVTDLGITWRAGRGSGAVHVRDLVRGGPVAAAVVTVLTPTNQVLARGSTDAQGLLLVDWPATGEDQKPFVVVAQRGDDVAFASASGEAVELADDGLGGRAYAGEQPEAWLWADRGIVRPGETIDIAAIVRDGAGLPVPTTACVFRYTAPNGRPLRSEPCDGGASGLAHSRLALPLDAPMGRYDVAVATADGKQVLGSTSFRVEAFVPDRLEAEVVAVGALRFGATGSVTVRGRWLDGSPAVGRAVTARVRLLPHAAAFAGADGFGFTAPGDEPPPGELPAMNGTLDGKGEAELVFALPADAPQQTLLAHVAVEVLDPSGRPVRAVSQTPVLRSDLHLGVRAEAGRAALRAVAADGSLLRGELAATVRLERRSWQWRYENVGNGRWRWQTTRHGTSLGEWSVTLRDGVASLPLPVSDGECALVATAGGRQVEVALGAVSARPDRLRVRGPDAPVAAGGAATLVVTSPAAGHGCITLESDRVLGAFCCELQRGDTTVTVPLPAGLRLPNVHAVVTLTRPVPDSGPDKGPAWLVGGAPIRLARPELELPLTLTAPAAIEPEQEWVATLHAPGATTAIVAVVDEGVLRVTGHAAPQPLAFFLASRALATDGADNGAALLQGMQFAAGSKAGGDGGDEDELAGLLAGAVDSRIRPLVRFAAVPLDAEGRGEARFALGGYEGRVRAVAIVAGPVGMAAARADTVVKAPLSVLVAMPRMAAPGDRFVVPITVRNALAAGEGHLLATASGALQLAGGGEHRVRLASGGETTWELPVVALAPSAADAAARLQVVAELGGVRRTVAVEFTVRQPAVPAQEVLGVDLAAGGDVVVASTWQQVEATVRLDARPEAQLGGVLTRLLDYPYGCAEQTMGKGMALLACRTLLPRLLGPGDACVQEADALTQAAVDRLLGMQTWSGGFGFWSGSSESAVVTAQVTDFLVLARQHGLAVAETALAEALDRCSDLLRRDGELPLRCLLADVLARAGRPVQPWLDWLCTAAVTEDDRSHLAAALAHLGHGERALALLRERGDAPLSAYGELASPLRSQALQLRARGAAAAGDPQLTALAAQMQRALARTATTTQEQWQGLRALAEYYRRQPEPGEAAATSFTVDGQPVAMTGAATRVALRAGSVLRFAAGGRGSAVVTLRGAQPIDAGPRAGDFTVQRTLVDVETGQPVERCRRGRLYEVRLVVTGSAPIRHLAVVDVLPGGLEPEPATGPQQATPKGVTDPDCVQHGDDRVLLFCRSAPERVELRHRVRATLPGTWRAGSLRVEAMYAPDSLFLSGPGPELVVDP